MTGHCSLVTSYIFSPVRAQSSFGIRVVPHMAGSGAPLHSVGPPCMGLMGLSAPALGVSDDAVGTVGVVLGSDAAPVPSIVPGVAAWVAVGAGSLLLSVAVVAVAVVVVVLWCRRSGQQLH